MDIIQTARGGSKLCLNGYMYVKKRATSRWIRWHCTEQRAKGCRGSITTDVNFQNPRNPVMHVHPPDRTKIEVAKLRTAMKLAARHSNDSPDKILNEALLRVGDDVRAKIGNFNSCKRDLHRQRQKKVLDKQPELVISQVWTMAGETASKSCSTNEDRSGDGASTTEESMFPDLVAPPETEQAVSPNPTTPSQQKPESYQLRHNNHMTLVLESLAQDEAFMDVTLTAQGRSIRAHKSVLSAVSPYFRGVLCENPCQHPIIIMPRDVRFDELQSIITYIYKGEMTVAAEDLSSLLKTAEILQVTGLTPADPQAAAAAASASFNPQFSSGFTSSETPRTSKPRVYHTTPKLQDTINPTDFMDMDMTCVKEEVMSGDEDDDEQDTSYHSSQILAHSKGSEPQPTSINQTSSSSSMTTTTPSTQTRYSSDADNPDPGPSPVKGEEEEDLISCQIPMSREEPEPFVCPHCKDTARGFDSLTLHLKTKHPSKLNFPCSCGRVYIRHGKYVDHIKVCKSGS